MTRVGSVCYPCRQGIGWIVKHFYDAGLIHEIAMFRHGSRTMHREWYPPETLELVGRPFNGPAVDEFLSKIDLLLQVETPFSWDFLDYCRKRGVRSVIVPMYEWWPVNPPFRPDGIICPSLLDQQYFPDSPYLPIPVESGTWRQRTTATRWLHGANNLGCHYHKGTPEILAALKLVKSPVDFTIKVQDVKAFATLLLQADWPATLEKAELPGGGTLTIERGDGEHSKLYTDYDVFIMAEKYNGESLPLKEARAAGMLVITSNRHPMNKWLPTEPLIPVAGYHKARMSGAYHEFDEAEVKPEAIAAKIDEVNGRDITQYSLEGREWAEANSWQILKPRWQAELERIAAS